MSTTESPKLADLPLSDLLLKRRSLKRQLSARPDLQPIRIALRSKNDVPQREPEEVHA